jgi:hypothetical protein
LAFVNIKLLCGSNELPKDLFLTLVGKKSAIPFGEPVPAVFIWKARVNLVNPGASTNKAHFGFIEILGKRL